MTKKRKLAGLEKRWLVNNVSVMVGLVLICAAVVTICLASHYCKTCRTEMESMARTASDYFDSHISLSYQEYYESCIAYAEDFPEKDRIELQFVSTEGELLASSFGKTAETLTLTSDLKDAVQSQKIASFQGSNPDTGERILAVSSPMVYPNGELVGILRYVTSLRQIDRQVILVSLITFVIGLIFIICLLLVSGLFIRSVVEPITQINAMAKRIAGGSYGVRIPKQNDDEIGDLVDTINDMSSKIGQTERMQAEFISSVSHELRTPLTAISGWGETLQASDELSPDLRRGVIIILREAKRLTGMVEELLDFTRMQDGRLTLNVEQADLLAEFEDTVFMYGTRLKQEGIELEYEPCEEEIPEFPCDVSRMRQVFLNILDNAAKHGGDGKRITASMKPENGNVIIQIRDYGCGIPEEELPHVKMKFYKGSSKARGSGIGLAVCDEIVSMHGGQLELANAEGGGTLVTIRLPSTGN